MRRVVVRAFMALVGFSLLVLYVVAAYVGYLALLALWRLRPPLPVAVGVIAALTVAFGYLSYRYGTVRLLAGLDAVDLPRSRAPELHRRIDRLAERMDLRRPRIVLARMRAPNALALGGAGDGVLVFDRDLLRLLNVDEVEAIAAHELAHLESHDSLIQTLAYSAVRSIVGLALVALLPVLLLVTGLARALAWIRGRPFDPTAPSRQVRRRVAAVIALLLLGLTLAVRAHSRRREYAADDRAVEVTKDPRALANALVKIDRAAEPRWGLLSPLYTHGDEEGTLTRMLSTHPPLEERIERLLDRSQDARRIEIE